MVRLQTVLAFALLVACDSDPPAPPPQGPVHRYVTSSLHIPLGSAELRDLAFDLDGDPDHKPDNGLGTLLSATRESPIGLQEDADARLAAGELVGLHKVQVLTSLTQSEYAWWSVYQGADTPAPDFSGSGTFSVDATDPVDSLIVGRITNGVFTGGPGRARIELALGQSPVAVDLIGARITATLTETGCTAGRLGGGVTMEQARVVLFPAVAASLSASLAADPGCPAACESPFDAFIEQTIDLDHDGAITPAEIDASSIFQPDVDLLDADGVYAPRSDGTKESLSIAFGFECVKASF